MRMICEQCGETAAPVDVWIRVEKVALECAGCGALNRVIPSSDAAATARQGRAREGQGAPPEPSTGAEHHVAPRQPALGVDERVEVPPFQCLKCGHRQELDEACARCGFVPSNYVRGEMPWEKIPEGKEEAWSEALRSWEAVEQRGESEDHEAFIAHCVGHGLEELAGRRYRFRIADRPDDHAAREQLEAMLERGRAALVSRMETTRESTKAATERTKRALLWLVFAFGVGLVLLFVWLYPSLLG